jgi:hypothetical protein
MSWAGAQGNNNVLQLDRGGSHGVCVCVSTGNTLQTFIKRQQAGQDCGVSMLSSLQRGGAAPGNEVSTYKKRTSQGSQTQGLWNRKLTRVDVRKDWTEVPARGQHHRSHRKVDRQGPGRFKSSPSEDARGAVLQEVTAMCPELKNNMLKAFCNQ